MLEWNSESTVYQLLNKGVKAQVKQQHKLTSIYRLFQVRFEQDNPLQATYCITMVMN